MVSESVGTFRLHVVEVRPPGPRIHYRQTVLLTFFFFPKEKIKEQFICIEHVLSICCCNFPMDVIIIPLFISLQ